jgi:uncharacterized protein YecE (DUF72 family)
MDVRVARCGWTVSMRAYVECFPLVEVQHTFYEPPADSTFEFTMKAWQLGTHTAASPTYRWMKKPLTSEERAEVGAFRSTPAVRRAWQRTLECAAVLRTSGVPLQRPKSFAPRPTTPTACVSCCRAWSVLRGLLWEPRGDWPDSLVAELCRDLDLVPVVDPMQRETGTPEQTCYRRHGTTGMRHVPTDEELRGLRHRVRDRPQPYVPFNNLPNAGDADRFHRLP